MRLFRSKEQSKALKELPLLDAQKVITKNLELHSLRMVFSVSQTKPYTAEITYCERPLDYSNHGTIESEKIDANTWSDLVEKVLRHFHSDIEEDPKPSSKE